MMAHHPVYSDGMHDDHPILVRDWDPLFRKYKVDLYLAGGMTTTCSISNSISTPPASFFQEEEEPIFMPSGSLPPREDLMGASGLAHNRQSAHRAQA
jgi:hypothetical protein